MPQTFEKVLHNRPGKAYVRFAGTVVAVAVWKRVAREVTPCRNTSRSVVRNLPDNQPLQYCGDEGFRMRVFGRRTERIEG